jgi:hypothetical protein
MNRLLIGATVAAFGAAVVLPAAAIIGSTGAYAAQKTAGKTAKKKPKHMYHKMKKTHSHMNM